MLPIGSVLFLKRYREHRHLPSFPTRRSSDLALDALPRRRRKMSRPAPPSLSIGIEEEYQTVDPESHTLLRCRSEEHTSELQSRVDLVCRLLLEKKKK